MHGPFYYESDVNQNTLTLRAILELYFYGGASRSQGSTQKSLLWIRNETAELKRHLALTSDTLEDFALILNGTSDEAPIGLAYSVGSVSLDGENVLKCQ